MQVIRQMKIFQTLSPLGKLPKGALLLEVLRPSSASNRRDESPCWAAQAHLTPPHALRSWVQSETQRGLTGLPRTTHLEATETHPEARNPGARPFSGL